MIGFCIVRVGRATVDGVVRDVKIKIAIVVEVGHDSTIRAAEDVQVGLIVERERAFGIAEKLIRFRAIRSAAKGADIKIGKAISIDIAPDDPVPGDARDMGKQSAFVAGIAKGQWFCGRREFGFYRHDRNQQTHQTYESKRRDEDVSQHGRLAQEGSGAGGSAAIIPITE